MVSRIEQLINEIEEFIDGCKSQPFSNSNIIVNKEELEELLVELRLRIPDEIKQYQKIISNQDAILNRPVPRQTPCFRRQMPRPMSW